MRVEDRAQHTALCGAGAQGEDRGGVIVYILGSVGTDVQYPVAEGDVEAKVTEFSDKLGGDGGVLKNSILTYVFLLSRWERAGCSAVEIAPSVHLILL